MHVCLQKKKNTHNFSLCQTNSLTHLHVASSESHKSNIRNLSLSLSLSLINMSKVTKSWGITYSFRSVPSSTQILTVAKWLLPLCVEMLTLVRIYLDFSPPTVCWPCIVFRFIIEYNSLRVFGPFIWGFLWKMVFWLVLKIEISYYRVIISWRILVLLFKEDFLKIIVLHGETFEFP
jgi:hypothetical protein